MQIDLGKIKITWRGDFVGGTSYEADDAVHENGSSYICTTPNSDATFTVSNWDVLAAGVPSFTTHGQIVFRGETGVELLEAGTSGFVLTTRGRDADPEWALPSSRQGATVTALPKTMYGGAYRSGGVIMSDNTLRAWGHAGTGNLGQGSTLSDRSAPTPPAFPSTTATVTQWHRTGRSNWCLMSDGSVYVWGYNGYGQLGTGNTSQVNVPTKVAALDGITIVDISVGCSSSYDYNHVVFRTATGTVYACGYNGYGQLGLGNTTTVSTPTALDKTDFVSIKAVGAQFGCSFGIDTAGNLWAWGDGSSGKLGLGSTYLRVTTPQQVTLPATVSQVSSQDDRYAAAATFEGHTLVLLTDGRVYAAGDNSYGALGLGNTTNYTSFQHVSSLGTDNTEVIAAGGFHGYSIVRKTDGTIRTFGYNGYGQLGLGNTTNISSPSQPAGVADVTKVLPYGLYEYTGIAVLTSDGKVKTAGYNGNGQAGVGNTSNVTTFTEVLFMNQTITDICTIGSTNEVGIGFLDNLGRYYQTGYGGGSQLPEDDDESITVPYLVQF